MTTNRPAQNHLDRRTLLAAGITGAAAATMTLPSPAEAAGATLNHFQHGVASGDPLPDRVVIWTRVTPTADATAGSGKGEEVLVRWEISPTADFKRITGKGSQQTGPDRDHTVKLDVTGLAPESWYFYRFTYNGQTSRVGRTRTAPAADATPDNVRFGVVSCSNLQAGWFASYRHLAERDDLHAIIHLGDYLYEYGPGEYGYGMGNDDVRPHEPAHEMHTLADYRIRHAQYKRDVDLSDAHARLPWIVTWDDHESANDAWMLGAENNEPGEFDWIDRKTSSNQAYDEWMPLRVDTGPDDEGATVETDDHLHDRIYRRLRFGTLLELSMLDLRSYRSEQASRLELAKVDDPDRTITGDEQLAWLKDGLLTDAQWKIVGNPVMIAPVTFGALPKSLIAPVNDVAGLLPDNGIAYNLDQWDGYTADRTELFEHIRNNAVTDTVFVTGDIHSAWACDLPYDSAVYPLGKTAGVEFVATSVTSNNLKDVLGAPRRTVSVTVENIIKTANRHVRHLNFDDHGFSILDVTRNRAQMDWWTIGERRDSNTTATWSTSYATATGSNRIHRVTEPLS
ncbi:alkaline phosphatase D [Nocardioides albertanoniae]|uniref:Alkaline phosphatase D n=1 Tax=Nocardioides albertanoniae TaxID=1175486 RepID=A0A543ACT6_9ACTN|nr:alkaline phosphatase D family protein [Nocardioides albertanoniae]TQL70316.1 alkaline phosphatase D [Nocardioides albertanoniae]